MNSQVHRPTLTRERVLSGAVELADHIGIEAFTIRKLAAALGVKPMTIYHHVASKDEIVDGMVELVFSEIELPTPGIGWRAAIRARCVSARQVLNLHPWAPPLMESRTNPGPATLGHHDAVLRCFRDGGLSLELAAHAYAVIDSYVYGFALEEAHLPGGGGEEIVEMAAEMAAAHFGAYPHLSEFTTEHVLRPGYHFGNSFEFGLDLILDGLDRASRGQSPGGDDRAMRRPPGAAGSRGRG